MPDIKYIAIVDDHTLMRKGLTNLINLFTSYKVLFEASDGRDFINKLNGPQYPDIVLLDINMPNMDGYDTANWIKENHPGIKILTLSLLDTPASVARMGTCGASGVILKDADPRELKKSLDEVIAKGYYQVKATRKDTTPSILEVANEKLGKSTFTDLTEGELRFLRLACTDKSYAEIANTMFLKEEAIESFRDALFKKLNVRTRVGLVMYAIKNNIFKLE